MGGSNWRCLVQGLTRVWNKIPCGRGLCAWAYTWRAVISKSEAATWTPGPAAQACSMSGRPFQFRRIALRRYTFQPLSSALKLLTILRSFNGDCGLSGYSAATILLSDKSEATSNLIVRQHLQSNVMKWFGMLRMQYQTIHRGQVGAWTRIPRLLGAYRLAAYVLTTVYASASIYAKEAGGV